MLNTFYCFRFVIFDPNFFDYMKFFKFLVSKVLWLNLLLAFIFGFAIIVGVTKLLHSYTLQDQKIKVPDLLGLSEQEVAIVLKDLTLTYRVLEVGSFNPKVPKNAVLDQQPKAGSIVKENRKIYITLNPNGFADAMIPSFYGKTQKEIIQLIKNSGFKIGEYEEIDDVGTVVRGLKYQGRELQLGEKLPKNSTIDIVIGNGLLSN